ncbi:MAG TPA: SH3 domain-containing protein [Polyangia bacterium]|nr:SH3 domain-containing protein [Polyangia bacterium]
MLHRLALLASLGLTACGSPQIQDDGDPPSAADGSLGLPTIDENGDGGAPASGDGGVITVGGQARVIADSLNLRDGVGTGANVLTAMPCGSTVTVVGGPSTTPAAGWWNVTYQQQTGWASGKYLVAADAFPPGACGLPGVDGGVTMTGTVTAASIFALATSAVGYSYYWGHGSWRTDGTQLGTCTGSCPSCSHTGVYGADCSGFVAKVWQVPSASPVDVDAHPYSTANFYSDTTHWKPVPRSSLQPADALVHRTATEGHIALYESGSDPFGNVWLYEARGCATGIVHDLRTPDSTYIAIRRDGL